MKAPGPHMARSVDADLGRTAKWYRRRRVLILGWAAQGAVSRGVMQPRRATATHPFVCAAPSGVYDSIMQRRRGDTFVPPSRRAAMLASAATATTAKSAIHLTLTYEVLTQILG